MLDAEAGVEFKRSALKRQKTAAVPKGARGERRRSFGIAIQIANRRVNANGRAEFAISGVLRSGSVVVEVSDDLVTWDASGTGLLLRLPGEFRR